MNTVASIDRDTYRDIGTMQNWAVQCGVQADEGFCMLEQTVDGHEDWYAATSTGGMQGQSVLYVPNEMIFSANQIIQEYETYAQPSLDILAGKGLIRFDQQFYLFLRILVEYEAGDQSPWYPWINSLPRKWNTAASMDDFCLSCLPPFIKSLCSFEQSRLRGFRDALQAFEYISPETKANAELAKFAYNVVFTRAFPSGSTGTACDGSDEDLKITPVADMFNHGYPENCQLYYDDNGGCSVILTQNVEPGTPLTISYGQPTNPSRFLATFGFLNEAPATYCKLLVPNPSKQLEDIGYEPSRMLFGTQNGDIAPEVWDVMLYSRLERKAALEGDKNAFYQAVISGNEQTKQAIHAKYLRDTTRAMQRHVNFILSELAELQVKTNAYDSSKHPRLPVIRRHNEMVVSTFQKVKATLDQMF